MPEVFCEVTLDLLLSPPWPQTNRDTLLGDHAAQVGPVLRQSDPSEWTQCTCRDLWLVHYRARLMDHEVPSWTLLIRNADIPRGVWPGSKVYRCPGSITYWLPSSIWEMWKNSD